MTNEPVKSIQPKFVKYVTLALVALLSVVGFLQWDEYRERERYGVEWDDLDVSASLRISVEAYRAKSGFGSEDSALDFRSVDSVLSRLVSRGNLAEKDAEYFRKNSGRFVVVVEKGQPNFEVKSVALEFKKEIFR